MFLEADDARRSAYPPLHLPQGISSATVPLIAGDRVLGALTYRFADGQPLAPAVRSFVAALGNQCAQAIDRALLFEAENAARLRAEQLADISARLAVAADPEHVNDITAEAGTQMLGAAAAAVVLGDGDRACGSPPAAASTRPCWNAGHDLRSTPTCRSASACAPAARCSSTRASGPPAATRG